MSGGRGDVSASGGGEAGAATGGSAVTGGSAATGGSALVVLMADEAWPADNAVT